jgi:hypothetical protein
MMWIVWITVGLFVGWHLPQPQYAKDAEAAIVKWVKDKATSSWH